MSFVCAKSFQSFVTFRPVVLIDMFVLSSDGDCRSVSYLYLLAHADVQEADLFHRVSIVPLIVYRPHYDNELITMWLRIPSGVRKTFSKERLAISSTACVTSNFVFFYFYMFMILEHMTLSCTTARIRN